VRANSLDPGNTKLEESTARIMRWWTLQQLKSKNAITRRQAVEKLAAEGGPDTVEPLLVALSDPDNEVRHMAAIVLGQTKDERALPRLVQALADSHSIVRAAAAEGLKLLGNADAVSALAQCLLDANGTVRWRVAQALESLGWQPQNSQQQAMFWVAQGELDRAAELGDVAVDALVLVLHENIGYQRQAAVHALRKTHDKRIVRTLIPVLKDEDHQVRAAVIEALSVHGDPTLLDHILPALKDAHQRVRLEAAEAIGKIGCQDLIDKLLVILRGEKHWEVRLSLVRILAETRDPGLVEPFIENLSDPDKEVREACVKGLAELGDRRAIEPLVLALIDEQDTVRQAAVKALCKLDAHWEKTDAAYRTVPRLKGALKDKEYWVRQSAADALARIGNMLPAAAPTGTNAPAAQFRQDCVQDALIAMLLDWDRDLRQAAVEALGRVGDQRAVNSLVPLLQDEDSWVRKSCATALAALQWQPADVEQNKQFRSLLQKW
jgi:HEAT repeat protein